MTVLLARLNRAGRESRVVGCIWEITRLKTNGIVLEVMLLIEKTYEHLRGQMGVAHSTNLKYTQSGHVLW